MALKEMNNMGEKKCYNYQNYRKSYQLSLFGIFIVCNKLRHSLPGNEFNKGNKKAREEN